MLEVDDRVYEGAQPSERAAQNRGERRHVGNVGRARGDEARAREPVRGRNRGLTATGSYGPCVQPVQCPGGAQLMKIRIAVAAGTLSLALASPAAASPREYSRGYYDCLAGRYDQDEDSHAYRQGCRAAQREQERGPDSERPPGPGWDSDSGEPGGEHPPGPPWGPNGAGPGWGPSGGGPAGVPNAARPAGVPNVRGMAPAQVLTAMASYGYRNVGTTVVGGAIFGIYFNPATRECVQVANANGRAVDALEIGSNPRCR